jgi:hypothetical protein
MTADHPCFMVWASGLLLPLDTLRMCALTRRVLLL